MSMSIGLSTGYVVDDFSVTMRRPVRPELPPFSMEPTAIDGAFDISRSRFFGDSS